MGQELKAGWSQDCLQAADGTRLYYQFHAAANPAATVVILHGHGEHAGRYEKFPQKIGLPLNYAICDMRGQGRSEGREVYVERFDNFLQDVDTFLGHLRSRHGLRDMILFGHSLGGLVAVHWLLKRRERVRGLILSSPCLGVTLPALIVALNNTVEFLSPAFLYSNPVYPAHLTHNTEEVEAYRKDPFIKRKITARLLCEMQRAMRSLESMDTYEFSFPVHILMAENLEKVVDPAKTRLFFSKLKAPEKSIKAFTDFYHEIFNERDQDLAFAELKIRLQSLLQ